MGHRDAEVSCGGMPGSRSRRYPISHLHTTTAASCFETAAVSIRDLSGNIRHGGLPVPKNWKQPDPTPRRQMSA